MTNGITALEGFDYQAMVALESMLEHFDSNGPTAKARPEGIDDIDLVHDDHGVTHRVFIQVKKPRQDVDGLRSPSPWTLREVLDALLTPRWTELQDAYTQVRWVLGDAIGDDVTSLMSEGAGSASWAARRAAAEWVVRARRFAPLPKNVNRAPSWESPFAGESQPEGTDGEVQQLWADSFDRRAKKAGFEAPTIATWTEAVEQAHAVLDQVLHRVVVNAQYAEAAELRDRLTQLLADRFGLDESDVRHVVFRNLRGFVDDVARARGTWINLPMLENEISQVWPRRVATVLPPPLPKPHLPRPAWVGELASHTGAVIGPSGTGKTTSATELYEHLRNAEPDTVVLYAEVREDTVWQNVLEGVVHSVGRRGATAPYGLLPSIRAGNDEALLTMADILEDIATPVALLVDLVDGRASTTFERDVARFAQRLPVNPKTRLWIFGQVDALADLAEVERVVRGLGRFPAAGFDWKAFYTLAGLHGLEGRSELYPVYEALTSGRTTGVPPRIADAVLRLGTAASALEAARSDDVLLAADTARYERLSQDAQVALGALACFAHPFSIEEAEVAFPSFPVKMGIRAGVRVGLLHPMGDGRTEFHETVRRNVLAQQACAFLVTQHARLVDVYAARGDRVLEAHHAEEAGFGERAKEAGRAAFFCRDTADRVGGRAIARGWVNSAEVFVLLREDPHPPHGWWRALHDGIDNDTAQNLIAWWREELGQRSDHRALWSAPRALVAARPDLILELLDIVAACAGDEDGNHYGASALGYALGNHQFEEAVVLNRFERATKDEQRVLADTLCSSRAPRCLARWLAYLVETDTSPQNSYNVVDLSDAHVVAIIDALPDPEPAQLLVRQDWCFGAASQFLWKHRDAIGASAFRLLQDDDLAPKRACVAIRLLGITGHDGLFDAARRWGFRQGDAQSVALMAPLLVNEDAWREELARLALDPSIDTSVRIAAFGAYVQSGEGGKILFERMVGLSPNLESVCRWTASLSFIMRPSLFALDMLLEYLTTDNAEQAFPLIGPALSSATHFADGAHAETVAMRLVPLLDTPSPDIRIHVLRALTMLRQRAAREACVRLALAEAGTPVGGMAAVAACASRPDHLSDVREALKANPGNGWLLSVLAARLVDSAALSFLVAEAEGPGRHWAARRRALLTLERLPQASEVDDVIDHVLAERSLLGALDTMSGQMSEALARLMQDDTKLFADLWRRGEDSFVDILAPVMKEQHDLYGRATPEQIDSCLRAVWRAVHASVSTGTPGGEAISTVLNHIQCSQVQSAALRVARTYGKVEAMENIMATSDSAWLVFQAVIERTRIDPRNPEDAIRWSRLVSDGACGADPSLQISTQRVLESALSQGGGASRARKTSVLSHTPLLTADDLHALLDSEQKAPPRARLGDMDNEHLASLVARLSIDDDHIVEVRGALDDAKRVSLTANGAVVNPPSTRSTVRKGDRTGLRARLVARFPDRVPAEWLDSPRRGHNFFPALIDALADEGDPGRALTVLNRLSDELTEIVHARTNFYRLGRIADDDLVHWIIRLSGFGGPAQVEALASFARQATADAVVSLLWRLMRRVEGHVADTGAIISHELDDPWRQAFVDLLHAERLRDVPGAGAWLVKMLTKTRCALTRASIVEAMAAFPSTWSVVETEVLRGFEYVHLHQPRFLRAEEIAHALFWATWSSST